MRRSTAAVTAVTALTGAVVALSGCGGAPAQPQTSVPAHASVAAAQGSASSGSSAAAGASAAAPAQQTTSDSGSRGKHGSRSGAGKQPATAPSSPASAVDADTSPKTVPAAGPVGGGEAGQVAPPPDWPASVPMPAGTITASSGSVSHWTVNVTVEGADTVVIARLVTLYKNQSFVQDPASDNPKVLRRNGFALTIFWRNRDHSAEATEVLLVLDRR